MLAIQLPILLKAANGLCFCLICLATMQDISGAKIYYMCNIKDTDSTKEELRSARPVSSIGRR